MVDSLPSQLPVPAISDKIVCSVEKWRVQLAFQEKKFRWAECVLRGSHWGYRFTQHFTQWSPSVVCSCTKASTPCFPAVVFKEFEGTNPQTV